MQPFVQMLLARIDECFNVTKESTALISTGVNKTALLQLSDLCRVSADVLCSLPRIITVIRN